MPRLTTLPMVLSLVLVSLWALSGSRFLDWVFSMPDFWYLDDMVITAAVYAEEWKEALALPDLFGAVQDALHRALDVE